MKNLTYILALALASSASLISCSDFLEAENKSAGGDDKSYLTTEAGAQSLRTYCYYLLKNIATNMEINEDGTDLYTTGRSGSPSPFQQYNSLSSANSDVESLYTNCYKIINNCNELLEYGGGLYDSDAKFIRALAYFKLTQQFGSVPYCTTYINSADRNYPRTELKTIYDSMIADLEEVANSSSLSDITYDGTVNKNAAKALLAKVCLAAGWDLETTVSNDENGSYTVNGSTYFSKAAQYASALADATPLTNSFSTKWSQDLDYKNPETFFSVQYLREGWETYGSSSHSLQSQYGSYYGNASQSGCKQCSSKNYPTTKSLYLWDVDDERYEGTFMTTIYRPEVKEDGSVNTDWPSNGYYSYYTTPKTNIYWYYGNANMSKSEFETKLTELKSKWTFSAAEAKAFGDHGAFLMQDPVLKYTFEEDGTYSSPKSYNYDQSRPTEMQFIPPVRKFDDKNSTVSESGDFRPVVILHASEMYLAAAEAYIAMGQNDQAFKYLNALRTRAGLSSINSLAEYIPNYTYSYTFGSLTMLDYLLDERAREMYAERTRWEDLRRTHQLVRYNLEFNPDVTSAEQMKGVDGKYKLLRPIPSNELSNNTGISDSDQNPGYTTANSSAE